MDRLDVIVPVYNEGEAIEGVYRHLCRALDGRVDWRGLFVYDFDEDTTLPALQRLQQSDARVVPTRQTYGRGVVCALRFGFATAHDGPVAVVMGDDSDDLESLPEMLGIYHRAHAAVVASSRFSPGGSYQGGMWLKKRLSRAAGWMLHAGGLGTSDPTNNFKLYRGAFVKEAGIESRGGFEVALELTVKAAAKGLRVEETPGAWKDRAAGTSKFRLLKWLPHYLRWFGYFWMRKIQGNHCL